jgi:hypothetical protein
MARYLKRSVFGKPSFSDYYEITKQCEKIATVDKKRLNSEELNSECLHFKFSIKLDTKSAMASKNVEDVVWEEECIKIHKIAYTATCIMILFFIFFSEC